MAVGADKMHKGALNRRAPLGDSRDGRSLVHEHDARHRGERPVTCSRCR
jgi:hypothetical protein